MMRRGRRAIVAPRGAFIPRGRSAVTDELV